VIFDAEEGSQMNPAKARVASAHRSAATVVLAIAVSIAVYTAAGLLLVREAVLQSGAEQARLTLIVIAVFLALGSIAIRRTQLSPTKIQAVSEQRGIDGLIKHMFTVTLILAALAEGIGILAILMGRFGGSRLDVITFALVAAVILGSNFPRRAAWERAVIFFASTRQSSMG
jgi:hypothetical protein